MPHAAGPTAEHRTATSVCRACGWSFGRRRGRAERASCPRSEADPPLTFGKRSRISLAGSAWRTSWSVFRILVGYGRGMDGFGMSEANRDLRSGVGLEASLSRLANASRWSGLLALEGWIFNERRLQIYGSSVVAAYALGGLVSWGLSRGVWAVLPDGSLSNIDFCWIWASGKLVASSDPSQIYDHSVYAAAQQMFYRPGECLFMHQYIYPPAFL